MPETEDLIDVFELESLQAKRGTSISPSLGDFLYLNIDCIAHLFAALIACLLKLQPCVVRETLTAAIVATDKSAHREGCRPRHAKTLNRVSTHEKHPRLHSSFQYFSLPAHWPVTSLDALDTRPLYECLHETESILAGTLDDFERGGSGRKQPWLQSRGKVQDLHLLLGLYVVNLDRIIT